MKLKKAIATLLAAATLAVVPAMGVNATETDPKHAYTCPSGRLFYIETTGNSVWLRVWNSSNKLVFDKRGKNLSYYAGGSKVWYSASYSTSTKISCK